MGSVVTLHTDALKVSFANRKFLATLFRDILGHLDINHFALGIINPQYELLVFSSTPTLHYNLMSRSLWQYDQAYSPIFFTKFSTFGWQEAYCLTHFDELKQLKETAYHYNYGFYMVRNFNQFYILYEFATQKKSLKHVEFYQKHYNELLKIGDYCFKKIRILYNQLSPNYLLPRIYAFVPYQSGPPPNVTEQISHPGLKLVINNDTSFNNIKNLS